MTAMLADAARVESGKLFIHGGGWDNITTESVPTTHPSMALVLTVQVEYDEALRDIPLSIQLLDEDGNEVGFRLDGQLNVGLAPGSKKGSPSYVHQAITLNMLQFEQGGGYSFLVTSGDDELERVPFSVIVKKAAG